MPDDVLEAYIIQHIQASPDTIIRFSWHGGEPTLLGLDYFHHIVEIQKRHQSDQKRIINGIQTNGTLLTAKWCRFLKKHSFSVGLSLDGPQEMHDAYRLTKHGKPTHERALRGYYLLQEHGLTPDILCVVNAHNVRYPSQVYGFFKQIRVRYIGLLPLVEQQSGTETGVSPATVPAEAFGQFLCTIFDEWKDQDIGNIQVQIIEEAAKTALGQEHELCIFRQACGDVPVIEHNGDFYSCDHFVDARHLLGNIRDQTLLSLLESPEQIAFGKNKWVALPRHCRTCDVLAMCYGECPKNRFTRTPDHEEGLNYLCAGYKRFFTHIRPFTDQLAALYRQQASGEDQPLPGTRTPPNPGIGRNDPCPCGSGKKYKKCCLGK
jgi:uncharacterized protein